MLNIEKINYKEPTCTYHITTFRITSNKKVQKKLFDALRSGGFLGSGQTYKIETITDDNRPREFKYLVTDYRDSGG